VQQTGRHPHKGHDSDETVGGHGWCDREVQAPSRAESHKSRGRHIAAIFCVGALLLIGTGLQPSEPATGPELLRHVFELVNNNALDLQPGEDLYEKAARGLLDRINDPYAELFSPEQMAAFTRESIGDNYGGLGLEVGLDDSVAVITKVFADGPAMVGGLKPGDRIVAVDGQRTVGRELDDVTSHLRGRIGTPVEVTIARAGSAPLVHRVTRAAVHQPAVPFTTLLEDSIGYVPLRRFGETASKELSTALRALQEKGARRIVLDLRGNGGGRLGEAIDVASLFLPRSSAIVDVRSRSVGNALVRSFRSPLEPSAPLVVLTDGATASASEIVAGALQDNDRALVLGTVSYGKGLVQELIPLDRGWVMKLTTARWLTPSGRSIQRDGQRHTTRAFGRDDRPRYRSEAGRIVYGGGGIFPDSVVTPDTARNGERDFLIALTRQNAPVAPAVLGVTLERLDRHAAGREMTDAEARAAFRRRFREAGVQIEDHTWNAGSALIDRTLAARLDELLRGEESSFRQLMHEDAQLRVAISLLRGANSMDELIKHT